MLEQRLWSAADSLRGNSNFVSNEYVVPVIGLIFLRLAYSRFQKVRDEIILTLLTRGGKTRPLTKEDFAAHQFFCGRTLSSTTWSVFWKARQHRSPSSPR